MPPKVTTAQRDPSPNTNTKETEESFNLLNEFLGKTGATV